MLSCRQFLPAEVNVAHKLHHHHHTHHHPALRMPTRRDFLSSLICTAVLAPWAMGQQGPSSPSEMAERFRRMSEDYEKEGLAAPFKGITTNGEVEPGLFEIRPSGVSTEPVRIAAEAFIATLTPVQLARTMYPQKHILRKFLSHGWILDQPA